MRSVVVLVLLLLLSLPAVSTAQDITGQWLVQRDLEAATAYWGHTPMSWCSSYAVETGPTVGYAQTDYFGCTQTWNAEVWAWFDAALKQRASARPLWTGDNPRQRRTEYLRWSCELTIHEEGHSYGLPDEGRPGTIMFRASAPTDAMPSVCVRLWP